MNSRVIIFICLLVSTATETRSEENEVKNFILLINLC